MSAAFAPHSLGFVLFDSQWQVISATADAVSAFLSDKTTDFRTAEKALAAFAAEVALRMQTGTPPKTFSYADNTCTIFRFSCAYGQPGEPLNAALIGSPLGASSHAASFGQTFRLTPRETEALALCLRGHGVKEIAQHMGIGVSTAKSFLRLVSIKMGVTSRAEILSKVLDTMCEASLTCPFRPRRS